MTDLERLELLELRRQRIELGHAKGRLYEVDDLLQDIREPERAIAREGVLAALAQVERCLATISDDRWSELKAKEAAEQEAAFQAEREKYRHVVARIHKEEAARRARLAK